MKPLATNTGAKACSARIGGKHLRKSRGPENRATLYLQESGLNKPPYLLNPRDLRDFRNEVMVEIQVGEPGHTPTALFKSTTAFASSVK